MDSLSISGDTLLEVLRSSTDKSNFLDEPQLQDKLQQIASMEPPQQQASGVPSSVRPKEKAAAAELGGLDRPAEFGSYRLIGKLGQGGMGAVYKAVHTSLDKVVAIKVLAPGRLGDANAVDRFRREMKAIGRVQDVNFVVAHDAGEMDGEHFLVMEYVDGIDVSELAAVHGDGSGRLPADVAVEIIRQAAIGIQHAHDQGLIHRDIKPSNLVLDNSGVVKVLDLGLARLDSSRDDALVSSVHEITATGTAMGTIGYMSPEQAIDSTNVDPRTDIYSLGATLYKLLCGQLPFPIEQYGTAGKILVAIARDTPDSIESRRGGLPGELVRIVDKTLAKKPEHRIESASELARQLEPFATSNLAGVASGLEPVISSRSSLAEPTIAARSGSPPTRVALVALGLLLLPILYFAIQFLIKTEHGTVLVEIADEQVEAKLKAGGIEVVDQRNNKVWTISARTDKSKSLPAGKYQFRPPVGLVITDAEGLEINASEFKLLDSDKQLRLRVSTASTSSLNGLANDDSLAREIEEPKTLDPLTRQLEVAKWVISKGGSVSLGASGDALTVADLAERRVPITSVKLSGVRELNATDLQQLAGISTLDILSIDSTAIGNEELDALLQCKSVTWLSVQNTKLRSSDLVKLAVLPKLHMLRLDSTQIDDQWEFLNKLPRVHTVMVWGTNPPAIEGLAHVPSLLKVVFSQYGSIDLDRVANLPDVNGYLMVECNEEDKQHQFFGTGPREVAEQLHQLGWMLKGSRIDGGKKTAWASDQEDAMEQAFLVTGVNAPSGHSLSDKDIDLLDSVRSFYTLILENCSNIQLLPRLLARHSVGFCNLNGSSLDDATLLAIGNTMSVSSLHIHDTNVTREGILAFKDAHPACNLETAFGEFPPELRLPKQFFAIQSQKPTFAATPFNADKAAIHQRE